MVGLCVIKSRFIIFFFFSSRRRHTRFDCDWSSDVCSSDLVSFFKNLLSSDGHPFKCLQRRIDVTDAESAAQAAESASRSFEAVCGFPWRSEEHTSELQSQSNLVCRLLLEKKKKKILIHDIS